MSQVTQIEMLRSSAGSVDGINELFFSKGSILTIGEDIDDSLAVVFLNSDRAKIVPDKSAPAKRETKRKPGRPRKSAVAG